MTAAQESRTFLHEHWKALSFGTFIALAYGAGIFGTFWLVALQFWPQGSPVKVDAFFFRTPIVYPGGLATVHLEFDKMRNCQPGARIVFINPEGEERQFLFSDWPSRDVGKHSVNFLVDIPPTLGTGSFKAQTRVTYDCQDADYLVESPLTDIEIVAPPKP